MLALEGPKARSDKTDINRFRSYTEKVLLELTEAEIIIAIQTVLIVVLCVDIITWILFQFLRLGPNTAKIFYKPKSIREV